MISIKVFRNYKKQWSFKIMELSEKYGPIITVWIGPKPFVFICDVKYKDAFNKSELSGRPQTEYSILFIIYLFIIIYKYIQGGVARSCSYIKRTFTSTKSGLSRTAY